MVTRISGQGSGFDVDGTVAKLMAAARMPLDTLAQKKQFLMWQVDDYRTMNSQVLDLRNTVFNMKLDSNFQAKKASSSLDSVASATATANSTEGVYALTVNTLAVASSLTSSNGLGGDTSKTLGDPAGINLSANTTLSIGGSKGTATINVKKTDSIAQLIANINGKSSVTGVKLSYDSTLDRLFFVSSSTGAATKVDLKSLDPSLLGNLNGTTGLKLAGVTASAGQTITGTHVFAGNTDKADSSITGTQTKTLRITYHGNNYDDVIDSSKSVGTVIDEMNGSAFGKTGASAYLDSAGHLAIFTPDGLPVTFSDITVPAPAVSIDTAMGLSTATTAANTYSTVNSTAAYKLANATTNSVAGVDADILFNNVHGTYATNTFTVAGLSLTVKTGGGAITNIAVTKDVDTTFNGIKGFVDKYNTMISSMNLKIAETKDRNYPPLTDAQKLNMKDSDIVAWTAKAKVGTLQSDSIISKALRDLRIGLSDPVTGFPSGDINQLAQIGITTGNYQDQGKLIIDESKLRTALAANPDQVQKLFNADNGVTTTNSGQGLAVRMYNQLQSVMTQITAKAGTSISLNTSFLVGKQENDLVTQSSALTTKLNALEARYYKQFSAMDSAINKMNAQFSSFLSHLGK